MSRLLGEKQYHVDMKAGDVGGYALLPGDPKRCRSIAALLDDAVLVADHREFVTYTGTLEGTKVSVTSTGIGGPSAAIAMEELIRLGAHTFIRVGTCGGMQEEVRAGDIVIPTGAIRMGGTTAEYVPSVFPAVPHYEVVEALVAASRASDRVHHLGVVQCKDSFYGQHCPEMMPVASRLMADWEAWIRAGALASEMESDTVFVLGSIYRKRTGTVLLCINNQDLAKRGLQKEVDLDTSVNVRIGVEALRRLILADRSKDK